MEIVPLQSKMSQQLVVVQKLSSILEAQLCTMMARFYEKLKLVDLIIELANHEVTTGNCDAHSDWWSAILQNVKRFPIAWESRPRLDDIHHHV